MNRIQLLPEIVANQIAAGEVVNSPSHVVKEMMENSLDAGARCVRVNFRNGGRDLIQIVDDGCGMSMIDARIAFDRHATSKISTIEDVYKLHTFGFRGEALASIAAVSEVELRTRCEEDDLGSLTRVSGGKFIDQTPVACSKGSQFMVRNLFYNVPSRRKFIDKENSRLALYIKQEFSRVALCNPEVEFELRQNDALLYSLPPTNRAGRIVDIVGKHIKQNLLEVSVDTSVVRIEGFVGRPAAAKKRNNEQYLFVNGRYFQASKIHRAIVNTYDKLIPEGCLPSYFIYITVPTEQVDVNVHPQKTTVKFADLDMIITILQAAVRETLAKTGAVPMMDFSDEGRVDIPVMGSRAVYREPRAATNASYNPFSEEYIDPSSTMPDVPFTGFDVPYDDTLQPPHRATANAVRDAGDDYNLYMSSVTPSSGSTIEYLDEDEQEVQQTFDFIASGATSGLGGSFTDVMPIMSGYAMAMYNGRCVVVSLPRARERILYDDILVSLGTRSLPTQRTFFAEELTLSNSEYELLEEYATEFAALGFDIEYRGEGRIDVVGRPAVLDVATPLDELIYELLQGVEDGTMPLDEQRRRMACVMARRGSVGYGRGIGREQCEELLHRLELSDNPSFSPSGNPIMAELTVEELRAKLTKI